jgi:UDP-N-acetylmuramoylalanine--D-glutamate ligase
MERIQNHRPFLDRRGDLGNINVGNLKNPMKNFSGKTVTILGAARSGVAAAKLLLTKGALVKISDYKPAAKHPPEFLAWMKEQGVVYELGGHTEDFIKNSELIITSPGVSRNAQPLEWARDAGIPVWGELELGYRFCQCPIIAVTGSNGKTTVVTLIHKILQKAGKKSLLCGNVGTPFCDYVNETVSTDYVVLEVSSFQMESIITFQPLVSVLLNFSQNHLDRHQDLEEYFSAKCRIFENQTDKNFAVLNEAQEELVNLAKKVKGEVRFFNTPEQKEDLNINNPNFLAALTVADILGIDIKVCRAVFETFPGVEHRLERVAIIDGVLYINDSKATTAEAGRWALTRVTKPIILLCGGRDKHIDFSVLNELVRSKVKKIIVFGEAKEKMLSTWKEIVPMTTAETFKDAVLKARDSSINGDCVLLSPMCASFDMFIDYEDRGRKFKALVQEMKTREVPSQF